MDNISEKINLHQWAQDMADQKASKLSRRKWCESKGIPLSTYDYRCKKVRNALEEKLNEASDTCTSIVSSRDMNISQDVPAFAKVNLQAPAASTSGICIKLANAEVSIAPDTPNEHLRMVMEVLAYAK